MIKTHYVVINTGMITQQFDLCSPHYILRLNESAKVVHWKSLFLRYPYSWNFITKNFYVEKRHNVKKHASVIKLARWPQLLILNKCNKFHCFMINTFMEKKIKFHQKGADIAANADLKVTRIALPILLAVRLKSMYLLVLLSNKD